jgi:hypothetical protein
MTLPDRQIDQPSLPNATTSRYDDRPQSPAATAAYLNSVIAPIANDPVHRAAARDIPFQIRTARGSECNGLFASCFVKRGIS